MSNTTTIGAAAAADLCNTAALIILDPWCNIIRCIHCALGMSTLISIGALIRMIQQTRFLFHGNLMRLVASVLCLYILYTIALIGMASRSLMLYLFWPVAQFVQPIHTNQQQHTATTIAQFGDGQKNFDAASSRCADDPFLLVPVWLSVLLRLPTCQHALTYPLLHFAIMMERARATLRSRTYEHEGTRFGTIACALIWSLCALFSVWMVFSTLADQKFGQPQVYYTMVSCYNTNIVITLHHVLLVLVLLTVMADIAIMVQNKKMLHMHSKTKFAVSSSSSSGTIFNTNDTVTGADQCADSHSLSRAYQLNENIVTLQLFLPLDLAFAVAFSLYLFFSALLRSRFGQLQIRDLLLFIQFYELITCLLPLHILITVLVYLRFVHKQRTNRRACRAPRAMSAEEQRHIYMQHLRTQWAVN